MSFASQTKSELCSIMSPNSFDNRFAEAYAMLLFATVFSKDAIKIISENIDVIERARMLFTEAFFVSALVRQNALQIVDRSEISSVLRIIGHDFRTPAIEIDRDLIEPDSYPSFFRGAFLVAGTVTNPRKDYHLEFDTSHRKLSGQLMEMLQTIDLSPKIAKRRSRYVLYFKESEQIEDMLNVMGAKKASFLLMNIKIEKEIRNNANRVTNFEVANIDKTAEAAIKQINAIKTLKKTKAFHKLPAGLIQIAELRLKYPELTLSELGRQLEPAIGKSGVSHRLSKLVRLAEHMDEKKC